MTGDGTLAKKEVTMLLAVRLRLRRPAMKVSWFMGAALILAACGQAPAASPSITPSASASTASATASSSSEARLPLVAGPPEPLAPGTYLTPEGFEPVMSITVPAGWYGAASSSEFAIGQAIDEANEFAGGGLFVGTIAMPYDEAVAAFADIADLVHEQPATTGTMGGYEATTFYTHAAADHVILDPVAPGTDIGTASAQQVFIDADGTTIMIRSEVNDDAARAEIEGVMASIEFSDVES
jgi:hypothetical protein